MFVGSADKSFKCICCTSPILVCTENIIQSQPWIKINFNGHFVFLMLADKRRKYGHKTWEQLVTVGSGSCEIDLICQEHLNDYKT